MKTQIIISADDVVYNIHYGEEVEIEWIGSAEPEFCDRGRELDQRAFLAPCRLQDGRKGHLVYLFDVDELTEDDMENLPWEERLIGCLMDSEKS